MQLVAQEDSYGCGVACVANLVEIPYKEALKLFSEPQNASSKGFLCKDLVKALSQVQNSYEYFYIKRHKRKLIYTDGTIVFIKRNKRYPVGHYLARKNTSWIDPWINFPYLPIKVGTRKRLPGLPIYAIQKK